MKAGVNDEKKIAKNGMQIMFLLELSVALLQIPTKISKTNKIIYYYYFFFLQFPLLRIIVQVNEIP